MDSSVCSLHQGDGMRIHSYQFFAGGCYHIYNHAAQNLLLFKDKEDYRTCLDMFCGYFSSVDFAVIACCLMPNHYHLLITQTSNCPIYNVLSKLWFRYSKFYNRKYDGKGSIFAAKAQHKLIEKNEYLKEVIAYIHMNPVVAGLVEHPSQWEWSNYREWSGERNWIPTDRNIYGEFIY